jgi:hypothetical protein
MDAVLRGSAGAECVCLRQVRTISRLLSSVNFVTFVYALSEVLTCPTLFVQRAALEEGFACPTLFVRRTALDEGHGFSRVISS